eukprot:6185518-Pleurochrysis_carterae.AAC.1
MAYPYMWSWSSRFDTQPLDIRIQSYELVLRIWIWYYPITAIFRFSFLASSSAPELCAVRRRSVPSRRRESGIGTAQPF